ncbi:hypothetical protein M514_05844 [Trichuris suis]|uniref:Uncharacterized protein n=1 Tax=Trichuris suis TaxID=68888 RepID=A0A085M817_9BILA|nr:hypothetical protein M513_05844 [Trichuris suis]KFD61158.1 hypothetical protein M514_05844 [Trichuris suis]
MKAIYGGCSGLSVKGGESVPYHKPGGSLDSNPSCIPTSVTLCGELASGITRSHHAGSFADPTIWDKGKEKIYTWSHT